ncbi:MAG: hypothetical protein AAB906_02605 [Patescibacteria group bacterium]
MENFEKGGYMPDNDCLDMAILNGIIEELKKDTVKEGEERTEISLPILVGVYAKRAGLAKTSDPSVMNKIIEELDKQDILYDRRIAISLLGNAEKTNMTPPSRKRPLGPGSKGIDRSIPVGDK